MTKQTALLAALALSASAAGAQDIPVAAQAAATSPAAEQQHVDGAHKNHADMAAPKTAMLLEGYGGGGFTVSTTVPLAQAFFSNGLELGAAFAHRAASEAMHEAVRLDPACGMCLWGRVLMDGPTINYGKSAKERTVILPDARRAAAMIKRTGTPREKALTKALIERFKPGQPDKRDGAYAKAMRKVAGKFPLDNEIAVLTADAIMVAAKDDTQMMPAMPLLEGVLARAPDHTPAIHFYIHASEITGSPAKAEPFADRLGALAPRASHLVHMPSHTYYWVGRYQDAATVNARAVQLGKDNAVRLGLEGPDGVWGLPYHAHNVIFGLGGALMAGDARIGLDLGHQLVTNSASRAEAHPIMQLLAASGYFALARFDTPAAVLALPEPKLPYLKAARNYARGEVLARQNDIAGVKAELAAIPATLAPAKPAGAKLDEDNSPAPEQMLGITRAVLEGRIATLEGRHRDAAAAFTEAARIEETEDFSEFSDPPAFWYPVRRDVAAALLAAGDTAGALAAVDASLKLRPRDPEALALRTRIEAARGS